MLSDRDILKAMEKGEIVIEGFREENLTPNGYDLTIGEIMLPSREIHIKEGKLEIPPLTRFLVGSREYIKMGDEYAAQIWIKSRWARRGVLASFGLVDAGFEGILTMGAFASEKIEMRVGDKFAQLCFFKLSSPVEKTYEKRSGNYQKQKNIKI
ncbi:MAG: dCTP deaminase [Thermoplasmata archaeon]|nr:dCTP deaminase [Thermoplasmata archaeon]